MATGANDVVDELEGKRDDDDEKPADVGADAVDPKEIGAVVLIPNGVVVDEPAPNVNDDVDALGRGAVVEPNVNVDG